MGLAELGSFLQHRTEWKVQKPILQQQASDAHALSQSQQKVADVQAKAAQREYAKQTLTLDPDKVLSAANPMPDVQPMPAIQPPSNTDQPLEPELIPSSDPNKMPEVRPLPPMPPPSQEAQVDPEYRKQLDSKFGPAQPYAEGDQPSPQTEAFLKKAPLPKGFERQSGDSETPGSSQGLDVSAPRSTPNLSSTAGGASTAPEPTLPQVSLPPQTNRPQFTAEDLLVTPFYHLPKEAQSEILRQGHEQMKAAGYAITDQELIEHYNANQQRALPPITAYQHPPNLVLKSYGKDGPEFINSDLMNTGGNGSANPLIMGPDGTVRDNPAFLKPADVIQRRGELATTVQAKNLLGQARAVIQNNPEAYGQELSKGAGGTKVGQLVAKAKAMFGDPKTYDAQRVLEMQNLKGLLDTLGTIHIGRVTEVEWGALANTMPKLTDDAKTWNNWLDRFEGLVNESHSALSDALAPYGHGGQSLPSVDVSQPQVAAPGGASGPATISTKAEYDALPKGASFVWGPNGQAGRK